MQAPELRDWFAENSAGFDDLVLAIADRLAVSPLAVEKDYWVCRALRSVAPQHPGEVIFKGATSLEKMRIVHRFSEDLDLLVVGVYPSNNAAKSALRRMAQAAAAGNPGCHIGKPVPGGNSGSCPGGVSGSGSALRQPGYTTAYPPSGHLTTNTPTSTKKTHRNLNTAPPRWPNGRSDEPRVSTTGGRTVHEEVPTSPTSHKYVHNLDFTVC
ncbi:hypothetical protein ABIB25_001258 [Nakamurella sp. UYEF19]|uniref:nucleotidyl transferase AbiEii/AbiGii toxin family protein n=1 Tax=Nakamurella sp. UYEF19 TaxID=1756392 RepID=UPI003390A193